MKSRKSTCRMRDLVCAVPICGAPDTCDCECLFLKAHQEAQTNSRPTCEHMGKRLYVIPTSAKLAGLCSTSPTFNQQVVL